MTPKRTVRDELNEAREGDSATALLDAPESSIAPADFVSEPLSPEQTAVLVEKLGEAAIWSEDEFATMFEIPSGALARLKAEGRIAECGRRRGSRSVIGYRLHDVLALADADLLQLKWTRSAKALFDCTPTEAAEVIGDGRSPGTIARWIDVDEAVIGRECGGHRVELKRLTAWLEKNAFRPTVRLARIVAKRRETKPTPPQPGLSIAEQAALNLQEKERQRAAYEAECVAANWQAYRELLGRAGNADEDDARVLADVCAELGIGADRLRADISLLEEIAGLEPVASADSAAARVALSDAQAARKAEILRAKEADKSTNKALSAAYQRLSDIGKAASKIRDIKRSRPEIFGPPSENGGG